MATYGWRTDRPLNQLVREDTAQFDFYQLVRLLLMERHADLASLDQHVRFVGDFDMAFPGREVRQLRRAAGAEPIRIETGNYSLAGYLGVLPEKLAEQIRFRLREGDTAMADFLDLFNHRFNALRMQRKSRQWPGLNLQLPDQTPLAHMLSSVMGMAEPHLLKQLPISTRALLGMAGLLANVRPSPPVLTKILARDLGAPVQLTPLVGAWRDRTEPEQSRLGAAGLGQATWLGTRAWMPAAAVEVTIGPVPYPFYCRLLPNQRACIRHRYDSRPLATKPPLMARRRRSGHGYQYPRLAMLLRYLLNRRQDVWVRLQLATDSTPPARLTAKRYQLGTDGDGRPGQGYWGMRLGQTAWLAAPPVLTSPLDGSPDDPLPMAKLGPAPDPTSTAAVQRESRFLVRAHQYQVGAA